MSWYYVILFHIVAHNRYKNRFYCMRITIVYTYFSIFSMSPLPFNLIKQFDVSYVTAGCYCFGILSVIKRDIRTLILFTFSRIACSRSQRLNHSFTGKSTNVISAVRKKMIVMLVNIWKQNRTCVITDGQ